MDSEVIPESPAKIRVAVLARKTYFETERTFPFTSLKDIRQAVATDVQTYCPFDTDLFFMRKIQQSDGKTRVNLWFVKKSVAQAVKQVSPVLVFPESFLFVFAPASQPALFAVSESQNYELLVHVDESGAVKSLRIRSGEAEAQKENFLRLCGWSKDFQIERFEDISKYKAFREAAILRIPLQESLRFFNKHSYLSGLSSRQAVRYLALAAGLLLVYMAATTWMIHQKKNDLQHMDHSLRQQTESLVEKRNQLETDMERLVFFHDLTRSYWSRTLLIQSLMETAPKGLRIKKLEIFGSTVEIEGLAPNASAFMTALSSKKEIQAARFTSPLKKDSKTGMEKFTLVFETLALAGKRQYGKD